MFILSGLSSIIGENVLNENVYKTLKRLRIGISRPGLENIRYPRLDIAEYFLTIL